MYKDISMFNVLMFNVTSNITDPFLKRFFNSGATLYLSLHTPWRLYLAAAFKETTRADLVFPWLCGTALITY